MAQVTPDPDEIDPRARELLYEARHRELDPLEQAELRALGFGDERTYAALELAFVSEAVGTARTTPLPTTRRAPTYVAWMVAVAAVVFACAAWWWALGR